jgi:hypothetical protein
VCHRETPAREGQGRTGVESGEGEPRKLRKQARKSKAGGDVWEVRENKKTKRQDWFNRQTGESERKSPFSSGKKNKKIPPEKKFF